MPRLDSKKYFKNACFFGSVQLGQRPSETWTYSLLVAASHGWATKKWATLWFPTAVLQHVWTYIFDCQTTLQVCTNLCFYFQTTLQVCTNLCFYFQTTFQICTNLCFYFQTTFQVCTNLCFYFQTTTFQVCTNLSFFLDEPFKSQKHMHFRNAKSMHLYLKFLDELWGSGELIRIVLNNCGRHKTNQNLKFCKQTEKNDWTGWFCSEGCDRQLQSFQDQRPCGWKVGAIGLCQWWLWGSLVDGGFGEPGCTWCHERVCGRLGAGTAETKTCPRKIGMETRPVIRRMMWNSVENSLICTFLRRICRASVAPKSSQIFWLKLTQMISILDCSPKHDEMERNKLLKCLVDTDCFCPAAETTVGLAFVCRGVCCPIFKIFHSMLSVPTLGPGQRT